MDIELRLLRSFVQIYESGSLSRAAERLACTQAAMSMRLKMLETELGAALFIRHHHRLEPTARGSELYAKALGVLASYDEMMSLTRSRPTRDRVRVGMPDDYAMGFMGSVLTGLGDGLRKLELVIDCDLSANLLAAVQRHDLDLALVTVASRPAMAIADWQVPLMWLHAPNTKPVPTLAAYPEGCVFRRAMIGALELSGKAWHVVVQSTSHAGIMSAVRAGVATTSVAAGTGPDDLVEVTDGEGLPPLPAVPIYLVAAEPIGRSARKVVEELTSALDTRLARPMTIPG